MTNSREQAAKNVTNQMAGRRGSGSQTRNSPVKQQTAAEIDDDFENLIQKRGNQSSPLKNAKIADKSKGYNTGAQIRNKKKQKNTAVAVAVPKEETYEDDPDETFNKKQEKNTKIPSQIHGNQNALIPQSDDGAEEEEEEFEEESVDMNKNQQQNQEEAKDDSYVFLGRKSEGNKTGDNTQLDEDERHPQTFEVAKIDFKVKVGALKRIDETIEDLSSPHKLAFF